MVEANWLSISTTKPMATKSLIMSEMDPLEAIMRIKTDWQIKADRSFIRAIKKLVILEGLNKGSCVYFMKAISVRACLTSGKMKRCIRKQPISLINWLAVWGSWISMLGLTFVSPPSPASFMYIRKKIERLIWIINTVIVFLRNACNSTWEKMSDFTLATMV